MAKVKICLDAGHYGKYNRSPAVKEYYESDMNWKLHLLLKKYLEQYGFEVIQTRSNQATDMGLTARGKASKGCDLFISIHSNAVGSGVNESVDYPVVYVPLNGSGTAIGKLLADCIASTMGTKQKGEVKTRKGSGDWDYYSVIHGAVSVGVPGVILEHSFHTNTRSTKWLLDDSNLDKLAKAEAVVIADYYGNKKTETANNQKGMIEVNVSVLKKGAKGNQVKALQTLLIGYGYSCGGYGADGDFGDATDKAVRAYQKAKGLDVDGIVGSATWNSLLGVK